MIKLIKINYFKIFLNLFFSIVWYRLKVNNRIKLLITFNYNIIYLKLVLVRLLDEFLSRYVALRLRLRFQFSIFYRALFSFSIFNRGICLWTGWKMNFWWRFQLSFKRCWSSIDVTMLFKSFQKSYVIVFGFGFRVVDLWVSTKLGSRFQQDDGIVMLVFYQGLDSLSGSGVGNSIFYWMQKFLRHSS